jgi:hypothetical protein
MPKLALTDRTKNKGESGKDNLKSEGQGQAFVSKTVKTPAYPI